MELLTARYGDILTVTAVVMAPCCKIALRIVLFTAGASYFTQPDLTSSVSVTLADIPTIVPNKTQSDIYMYVQNISYHIISYHIISDDSHP